MNRSVNTIELELSFSFIFQIDLVIEYRDDSIMRDNFEHLLPL